jgi:hypothetical protein
MTLTGLARSLRPYIVKAAQSLDDTEAIHAVDLYDEWKPDTAYEVGYKLRRNGKVWRVRQAHTSQTGWEPENVPALFEEINETHTGTLDDPIPYSGSMTLESGKYYSQNGVVYLCIRDSVNPLYHDLDALIGTFVEVAN